jgi:hypothetical protein
MGKGRASADRLKSWARSIGVAFVLWKPIVLASGTLQTLKVVILIRMRACSDLFGFRKIAPPPCYI